jgi:hypothetical protein
MTDVLKVEPVALTNGDLFDALAKHQVESVTFTFEGGWDYNEVEYSNTTYTAEYTGDRTLTGSWPRIAK